MICCLLEKENRQSYKREKVDLETRLTETLKISWDFLIFKNPKLSHSLLTQYIKNSKK